MKVSYYSLGCKVNLYESEAIINQFIDNGFTLAQFDDICDVYIINTCSITKVSDAKSRKIIRQAIRRNVEAVIAVMGCYAQLSPEDIKTIEGVDVLVGTNNRDKLFDLTIESLKTKKPRFLVDDIMKIADYEEIKINRYNNKTRGFIKIQDGCDNYCSYCTIPYARGHIRSRKAEDIIEEIQLLTDSGMKEIVLTGINTASYGRDFEDYDFSSLLLDIVNKVENLGRIRISSIEVTEITDRLLKVIKENEDKFCNHFHIPLQAGANNTLKRMHRKYNIDFYKEKINLIKSLFKDVNITTDVLAGFSGETEKDFNDACAFIKAIGFGEMHIFPYSRRPKTAAYNFPNQIENSIKQSRVSKLLKLNSQSALAYRKQFLNRNLSVLVEKVEDGIAYGHSENYLPVKFAADVNVNDLVNVEITEIGYPNCKGELISV